MKALVFLKLGGSLITDKDREHTPRPDVIQRLAGEIAEALQSRPELSLLVGHGSGSFGHAEAHKYNTRAGVRSPLEWQGFAAVWYQARLLNQLVIDKLAEADLPVVAFPPSAFILARDGRALPPQAGALKAALEAGLIPVVNGDTVFDDTRGGTIISTEDVFAALAPSLKPGRILLAGIENGVYADFPACQDLLPAITSKNLRTIESRIQGSASIDVTGGMREKVDGMLALAQGIPGLEARIFSGLEPGSLRETLQGAPRGTRIYDE